MRSSCIYVEDKVNPVTLKWKWGEDQREDELPIVDQDTYLGVEISKDVFLGMHTYVHGKKSHREGHSIRDHDGCDPNRLAP